jgi:hypothetical protein
MEKHLKKRRFHSLQTLQTPAIGTVDTICRQSLRIVQESNVGEHFVSEELSRMWYNTIAEAKVEVPRAGGVPPAFFIGGYHAGAFHLRRRGWPTRYVGRLLSVNSGDA